MNRIASLPSGFRRFLAARVEAGTPGRVRAAIGALTVLRGLEAARILRLTHGPDTLRLPLFEWIPPPAPEVLAAVTAAWLVAGALFAAGWRVRLTGPALLAAMGYVLLLDQRTYSNHLYLLWLLVLLLTVGGTGRGFALGARREAGHGAEETVPLWAVTLLRIQVSLVYFFSAATKLNVYYLSGSVLCGSLSGWIALPETWKGPATCAPLAMTSILVEVFLALALWSRLWRTAAWAVGIGFHVAIVALLPDAVRLQLLIFGLAMVSLYPLFGTPPALRRRLPLAGGALAVAAAAVQACAPPGAGGRRGDAEGEEVRVEVVASGVHTGFDTGERRVIRDPAEWERAWRRFRSDLEAATGPPAVDFGREIVLLAAMGSRPTGGYAIAVDRVVRDGDVLVVTVGERSPAPGCAVTQAFTAPAVAVRAPRPSDGVRWVVSARSEECR